MKRILQLKSKLDTYENKKEKNRRYKLKTRYNITLETYNKMLTAQGYNCKICNTSSCKTGKAFAVDHCHTSQEIRGLLCANCNIALGLMGDDVALMKKAIKYLKVPWYVKLRKRYETLSNRLRD